MPDSVIYDRGYQSYQGESRGRAGARRAIVKDGIRRILGFRRSAKRKIFPWLMIGIGSITAVALVVARYLAGSFVKAAAEGLPSYPEFFDFYSGMVLLFVAFTIPEILGPDREHGVISVYFSRPLTVGDYLTGKALAYVVAASSIFLIPQLVMYVGDAMIADDGFLGYLIGNLDILAKVVVTTFAYVVALGITLSVIGAFINRTGFASVAFLTLNTIVASIIALSNFPGAKWASLLAFPEHANYIRDSLFDVSSAGNPIREYGFSVWWSVGALVFFAFVGGRIVYSRYRRLA